MWLSALFMTGHSAQACLNWEKLFCRIKLRGFEHRIYQCTELPDYFLPDLVLSGGNGQTSFTPCDFCPGISGSDPEGPPQITNFGREVGKPLNVTKFVTKYSWKPLAIDKIHLKNHSWATSAGFSLFRGQLGEFLVFLFLPSKSCWIAQETWFKASELVSLISPQVKRGYWGSKKSHSRGSTSRRQGTSLI